MSDKRGFGLVQVMVGFALVALLGLFMSQLFMNQNKSQRTVSTNYEVASFKDNVLQLLSDPEACKRTLGGLTIWDGTSTLKASVPQFKNHLGSVKFEVGKTYNDQMLRLKSASLGAFPQDPTIANRGDVSLSLEIGREGETYGGQSLLRSIPISILIGTTGANTNKILECRALGGIAQAAQSPTGNCVESNTSCTGSYEQVGSITRRNCSFANVAGPAVALVGLADTVSACPSAHGANGSVSSGTAVTLNICCPKANP